MAQVRPVESADKAGDKQQMNNKVPGSLSVFSRPWNKNHLQNTNYLGKKPYAKPSQTPPNLTRTDQQQLNPKTHEPCSSP
jgi:hypothetical protein